MTGGKLLGLGHAVSLCIGTEASRPPVTLEGIHIKRLLGGPVTACFLQHVHVHVHACAARICFNAARSVAPHLATLIDVICVPAQRAVPAIDGAMFAEALATRRVAAVLPAVHNMASSGTVTATGDAACPLVLIDGAAVRTILLQVCVLHEVAKIAVKHLGERAVHVVEEVVVPTVPLAVE